MSAGADDARSAGPGAVVVTGASTGIGRATALHLAELGFRVFAGVRREADAALLRESKLPGLEPLFLDVTDSAQIAAAAERVAAATGPAGIAGLVNNAGIGVAGMLEFMPLEDLRRQFEVNVVGLVAVTQAFLPLVRRRSPDPGRIVHVGSSSGYLSAPLVGAYSASKFAVEAIADSMRLELAPWRILVSLVEPGAIDTPIFDKTNAEADARLAALPDEARRLYQPTIDAIRSSVAKRVGAASPPETVARAIAHALLAARPRTRYRVGFDAKLQWALATLLPARARDWVLARYLGLPR